MGQHAQLNVGIGGKFHAYLKVKKVELIRHDKRDGGMSILSTFFPNLNRQQKLEKNTLANHINSTKFAFFPMKIFVSKATSSVKIFYWRNRHVDLFQVTVVFVSVYNNKAVYEHEKTASLQKTDVTGGF